MDTLPSFLTAAAHPLRWRLLGELARTDLAVRELTALVGQPQNLVSYHLAKLRTAGLVIGHRSTADRRDTYYSLDLARCADLLTGAGTALHPALTLIPPPLPGPVTARVLFLCTGNSSRSQIAEALLRHLTAGSVSVSSAGNTPKPVSGYALKALAARNLTHPNARSKHLNEFLDQPFDYVITLCDRVKEVCPEFPGHPAPIHWSIPNPDGDPSGAAAYERVTDDLTTRITHFLHTLAAGALR